MNVDNKVSRVKFSKKLAANITATKIIYIYNIFQQAVLSFLVHIKKHIV